MVMYVTSFDKQTGNQIIEYNWYIQHQSPSVEWKLKEYFNPNLHNIEIQADGDELEHIENLFGNTIPFPKRKRVVRFFGETATMILYNL